MAKNNVIIILMLLFFLQINSLSGCEGGCDCSAIASVTFDVVRSTITADTLVALIKSDAALKIIEFRSSSQKLDIKIPGAEVIYDNIASDELKTRLPDKSSMIIVYPGIEGVNIASLTEKIRQLGYESIIEYPDGINGWLTYGYETTGDKSE
ncbi:MAG: hypothetical protein PHF29_04685 [Candidatus Riflebacteria bacterium]|nr:hypothetical protein [Candidatus Riflebacteria bacterium]